MNTISLSDKNRNIKFANDNKYEIEDYVGGVVIKPKNGNIEVLHVFPHGGWWCPQDQTNPKGDLQNDLADYYKILVNIGSNNIPINLDQAIYAEHDAGTRELAVELWRRIKKGGLPQAIAFFHVARVFVDPNRHWDDAVPSGVMYSGAEAPLGRVSDNRRREIVEIYLKPWVDAIGEIIQEKHIKSIIHHHSFDKKANPDYKGAHVVAASGTRPHAEFFMKRTSGWKNDALLTKPMEEQVQNVFLEKLPTVLGANVVPTCGIDASYNVPALTPIVRQWSSPSLVNSPAQALVYEFRKDLFYKDLKQFGEIDNDQVRELANIVDALVDKLTRGTS